MSATEDAMRKAAHALPPSDFGSTRAIQAAAAVADRLVAERCADLLAALKSSPCPVPMNGRFTVQDCIKSGQCGCDNRAAIAKATSPPTSPQGGIG